MCKQTLILTSRIALLSLSTTLLSMHVERPGFGAKQVKGLPARALCQSSWISASAAESPSSHAAWPAWHAHHAALLDRGSSRAASPERHEWLRPAPQPLSAHSVAAATGRRRGACLQQATLYLHEAVAGISAMSDIYCAKAS